MIDQKLLKDLADLVNSSIDPTLFPYQKGNSIRIGKYVIRSKANGNHRVYNCETNQLVSELFSKSGAVALAKTLARGKDGVTKIENLDKEIQKWYNDCIFYKYTVKVTKDEIKRHVAETRYEIAQHKTADVRRQLDKYIYA